MLNVSLLLCVLSAETDSLQTLDNNHNSQQHQQQYNLFPSLDQNRYTRRGRAKQGNNIGHTLIHGGSIPIQTTHLLICLWWGLSVSQEGTSAGESGSRGTMNSTNTLLHVWHLHRQQTVKVLTLWRHEESRQQRFQMHRWRFKTQHGATGFCAIWSPQAMDPAACSRVPQKLVLLNNWSP